MRFFDKFFYKRRAKKVADYYNQWSEKFQTITDTFQGFRPANIDDFHNYTIASASLSKTDIILDAGCGVGGPAFYFAKNTQASVFALTNSSEQVRIIKLRKEKENISNLEVHLGDYHLLSEIFPDVTFTSVLFLESLGHSFYPEKAIGESHKVLKSGGKLYIRDLFKRVTQNQQEATVINKLVKEANDTFVYNHVTGQAILDILKQTGFQIEYCRMPDVVFESIDQEFEKRFGIRTPKGIPFVEPLEILAVKS